MRTKITRETVDGVTYYEPHYRTWYGMWKPIKTFYKSEFVEMPGWFTSYAPSVEAAQQMIDMFKQRK